MRKEIRELIRSMEKIKGEDVEIHIFHKLYGEQKIKCVFNPIVGEKIGFRINEQEIYIENSKIKKVYLSDNIYIVGDITTIEIRTD